MQDYTREEFAEILQKTHKMSGDVERRVFRLLETELGFLEIDLNYKMMSIWSGLGDPYDYAFQLTSDSYRTLEKRLRCFYEMLEID
tara:strand:- start:33759 stop:34016 length:258 start_codon:yes stop_codon:yes gene_type:complete